MIDRLVPEDRYRRWIVAAILTGSVIRAAIAIYFFAIGYQYPDESAYWHIGHRIREGHGLSMAYDLHDGLIRAGEPTAFWGFLLNIVVAGLQILTADNLLVSRLILGQLAWFLTLIGLLGFVRNAFTPLQVLLLVGVLALYPNLHFVAAFLMTEVLLTPLLALALWGGRSITSRWGGALSGTAFGLMHLTKATFLGFQPIYMAWLAWRNGLRRSTPGLVAMAAMTALAFGPWVARNHVQYGRVVLETKSGFNLWLFNNPRHVKPILQEDFSAGAEMPRYGPDLDEPARNDACRALFVEFVSSHPGAFARLCVSRFLNAWSLAPLYMKVPSWSRGLLAIFNLTLYALMVAGAVLSLRRRILPECVGVLVYTTALLTLTTSAFRQRSYVDPYAIILAVIAVSKLMGRWLPRAAEAADDLATQASR